MTKEKNILSYIIFSILFILISLSMIFIFSFTEGARAVSSSKYTETPPLVIIDPGHGGEDAGAIGTNGCLEKDINLSVAKKLQNTLASMGIKSILTRTTDTLLYDRNEDFEGRKKQLDMQERLRIARLYENAIFISIHQNSFTEEKYSGFGVYFSPNAEESRNLADFIQGNVKKYIQPQNNRAIKSSDGNIYLLDKIQSTAILIECGFLSNEEECNALSTEEYQNKLCQMIGICIENYLKQA